MSQQVAIAVVRDENRVLVGLRSSASTLAGLAEFPGGRVEPGETAEAAAVRECREETGLDVQIVEQILSTVHRYPHAIVELHFFDCRLRRSGSPPRPPFRWLRTDQLQSLEFPEANAAVLEKLAESTEIAGENPLKPV